VNDAEEGGELLARKGADPLLVALDLRAAGKNRLRGGVVADQALALRGREAGPNRETIRRTVASARRRPCARSSQSHAIHLATSRGVICEIVRPSRSSKNG
jgi:hypothetical protein